MPPLVILIFENGDIVQCNDIDNAKEKAISCSHAEGQIMVQITPAGKGGLMTTLKFDRTSRDWVAV